MARWPPSVRGAEQAARAKERRVVGLLVVVAVVLLDALHLVLRAEHEPRALVQARGRVLTRDQLMDKAMGADVFVTDRAIDVHVTAIRKKLGDANWLIHTVRGVGYRLQESPGAEE